MAKNKFFSGFIARLDTAKKNALKSPKMKQK